MYYYTNYQLRGDISLADMKAIMNAGEVIEERPALLDSMASTALDIYAKLLPSPDLSKEAHDLCDKKRILVAAVALAYVVKDASVRAERLKDALQELRPFKSPEYPDNEFPSDYSSLCRLFLSLRANARILLVPNEHTIHELEKETNPSRFFGNIPLSFSDGDKRTVGTILRRIERHFFSLGVYETTFRLLESKYLPVARSVLGRKVTSVWPLNKGAHPRDFGEKRFVNSYKKHLTLVVENARKSTKGLITYCEEDEAMLSQYEHYQDDILTKAVDPERSILQVRTNYLTFSLLTAFFSVATLATDRLPCCSPSRAVGGGSSASSHAVESGCCASSRAASSLYATGHAADPQAEQSSQ